LTTISRRDLLAAAFAAAWLGPARALGQAPPLRIGVTPVIPDDRARFLGAWSDWLGARLGRPVVFVERSRYREILDLLLRGQLDLAWICGYPYVQHRDRLSLLAVPRFGGQSLYRSYVIVAADAPAHSFMDLEDGLFAWSDPDSNSGYLYPRYRIFKAGRDPDRFFRRTFFTWGHPRSITAVAEGLADGAAVDSYVWETLARRQPELTGATRIVERSPYFGFPPLVAGPALSAADQGPIRQALTRQGEDAVGRALLADVDLDGFAVAGPDLYLEIARMAEELTGRKGS
jgi:phosphonate transport system substrate-binding protein